MTRIALLAIVLALTVPARAQQPDAALLQKALAAVQNQRNQALDAMANTEVHAATIAEENAKLKMRVQALEEKYEPKKDTPKP